MFRDARLRLCDDLAAVLKLLRLSFGRDERGGRSQCHLLTNWLLTDY
jgi:hypothetical protein